MSFLRTSWNKKFKLGLTKKKRKWRRARGRHNKIRENKKGHMVKVKIGFKNKRKERGKIDGEKIMIVKNLKQAEKIGKNEIVIIANVGKKKREAIEKILGEKHARILNLFRGLR